MKAYYNEIDPFCAQWLRNLIDARLIAAGDVDERSIKDVCASDLTGYTQCHFFAGIGVWSYALRCAGWPDDRPVWTGSCPCQPFSAAGKQKGMEDERHLWPTWFELIREQRPGVIFGEQVASKGGLAWLDLVQTDLEGEGYAVGAVDTPASGVGAPHLRQRLYFVGESNSARWQPRQQTTTSLGQGNTIIATSNISPMAHANGGDACSEGLQRGGEYGQQPQDSGISELAHIEGQRWDRGEDPSESSGRSGPQDSGLLGHTDNAGSQGWGMPETIRGGNGSSEQSLGQAGFVNGFWRDAEWIPCRDGKWRPAKSGIFPLAHGAPARVGSDFPQKGWSRIKMLRAYGNAIVAPVAINFIESYLEIIYATIT